MPSQRAAFLFDLDGTLVDSVYQHVLAWREALEAENIGLSVWRIHRKIGMSGGLLTNMLLRETGTQVILGSAIGFGGTMRPPTIAILPIFGRFRLRTPGLFDRRSDPVGDHNQRPAGDGPGQRLSCLVSISSGCPSSRATRSRTESPIQTSS